MSTLAQYLTAIPTHARAQFDAVWSAVQQIAPYADVGLAYGVPALRYQGKPLIAVAVFKAHVGVYPCSPAVIDACHDALAAYASSKGGFKVREGQKLPRALLVKLITLRKKEIDHMTGSAFPRASS